VRTDEYVAGVKSWLEMRANPLFCRLQPSLKICVGLFLSGVIRLRMIKPSPMKISSKAVNSAPQLRRELGRWDLTAIGVNQVIGSAIFLLPSAVAALLGSWSWIAFILAGLASLFVALCIAEVGSRFETTGGPYLYTRAAFGQFAAYEVGWMQWFTRVSSHASVVNGIALALGFYWPLMAVGVGRSTLIVGLTLGLTLINVIGIRQSSWFVNIFTVGKLFPLGLFILVGTIFIDWNRVAPGGALTWEQGTTAALLLIFVYGGFDVVPVPAGEASDPRRHLPFALTMTIVIVTLIMTAGQIVAMGTLPNLEESDTPLADASLLFMGGAGALIMGIGAVISMTGNNAGQLLTGSRMLFALAEHRELPEWFGRIHPKYRTPVNAILFHSVVALVLALSGSFVMMAVVSAVARLVTYVGSCAATLVLRSSKYDEVVNKATFTIPFGPVVPILAVLVSFTILFLASTEQLLGGLAALAAGALLFILNRFLRRSTDRGD
jgi:amino acid transporter